MDFHFFTFVISKSFKILPPQIVQLHLGKREQNFVSNIQIDIIHSYALEGQLTEAFIKAVDLVIYRKISSVHDFYLLLGHKPFLLFTIYEYLLSEFLKIVIFMKNIFCQGSKDFFFLLRSISWQDSKLVFCELPLGRISKISLW